MMFLYVYNDYISMYAPDTIEMMREGAWGHWAKRPMAYCSASRF